MLSCRTQPEMFVCKFENLFQCTKGLAITCSITCTNSFLAYTAMHPHRLNTAGHRTHSVTRSLSASLTMSMFSLVSRSFSVPWVKHSNICKHSFRFLCRCSFGVWRR